MEFGDEWIIRNRIHGGGVDVVTTEKFVTGNTKFIRQFLTKLDEKIAKFLMKKLKIRRQCHFEN